MTRMRWVAPVATLVLASAGLVGVPQTDVAIAVPRGPAGSCPSGGGEYDLDSVEVVEDLLVGVWIRCEGGPIPGALVDDIGLEVTPELGFHRLYEVDDEVVRARGANHEGSVTVHDLTDMNGPGSYQVDWQLLGGGLWPEFAAFTAAPDTMRFEGIGATYVRDLAAAPVDGVIPGLGGTCGVLDDPVTLGSGELESALVGVWLRCDGPPALGIEEAEAGIELTADGSAHRIYRNRAGGLVRTVGPGHSGTWTIVDDAQIDIDVLGSGTFAYHPTLFDQPQPTLRLLGMTGATDLQRWDGFAPITGPVPIDVGCGGLDDPITPASAVEAIELFVGVWIPCVGDAGPDGQAGIEFDADGRYYRVYRSPDGGLLRADGVGQEGAWSLSDLGDGRYSFSPYSAPPQFYESPIASMWIDHGTFDFPAGAYRRWDGDPPTLGPPRGPISRCGHLRGVVELDSQEAREARLIGQWTLCDAHSVHGSPIAGEVGIEFGADGRFHLLIERFDGTVSPGAGSGREGSWTFVGPQTLVLDFEGGERFSVMPVFLDDPDSVSFRVNRFGTDYVRGAPEVQSSPAALPATGGDMGRNVGLAALLIAAGLLAVVVSSRRRARA